MRTLFAPLVMSALALASCGPVPEPEPVQPTGPPEAAPPPMTSESLPAGTDLRVRLEAPLQVGTAAAGELFTGTVMDAIVAESGQTVVPQGAVVTGMVTGAVAASGGTPAALRLNVLRIRVEDATHPLGAHFLSIHSDSAGAAGAAIAAGDTLEALTQALGSGAGVIVSLDGAAAAGLPEGTIIRLRTRDTLRLR